MNRQRKKGSCDILYRTVIRLDLFGYILEKKHTDGLKLYRSIVGSVMSVTLLVVMMLYTVYKYNAMLRYNDTNLMVSEQTGAYTDKDVFKGGKDHFNVAFGLVSVYGQLEQDTSQYGRVKAKLKTWDAESIVFRDVRTKQCTREDLGIDAENQQNSLFFPIFQPHKSQVEWYLPFLQCIDQEFEVYGDYSSDTASHLVLHFEKCTDRPDCKSDTEILQWLRRKFIFTVQNEINFELDDYTENKITSNSKVVWYPINSQLRSEYINQIKITTLELQDSIPLGELEVHVEEIFTVVGARERPYEFMDNVHLSISFEMSLDRKRIQRNVFSLLDWIGEVGGLLEALFVLFSVLITFYNYKTFENYMVQNLYSKKNSDVKTQELIVDDQVQKIQKIGRIRLFFLNQIYSVLKKRRCKCLRPSSQERLHYRARQKLKQEVSLISWIRLHRQHKQLMKLLLTKLQISKVQAFSRYHGIKEDSGSASDSSADELRYTGSRRISRKIIPSERIIGSTNTTLNFASTAREFTPDLMTTERQLREVNINPDQYQSSSGLTIQEKLPEATKQIMKNLNEQDVMELADDIFEYSSGKSGNAI